MAYCNWCQLDSETDDFCVWCKRPLGTAKGVHQQARSDLHFLRSSDDDHHEATPIFAIIGAVVLLGLVAGALLTFHARKDEAAESDHWVLKDQAPDPAAQAQPTTEATYAAPPAGLFVPRPPTPEPQKPSSSSPGKVFKKDDYVLPTKSNGSLEGVRGENTLYFEAADFAAVADKKGAKHLIGDVVVVNDTYGTLDSGALWLRAGNSQFNLVRYDGSINDPHILKKFAISGKASLKCHVLAKDLNPGVNFSGKRVLGLDGLLEGQPIHVEDELIVRVK